MGGFYRFPPMAKLCELTSKQQLRKLSGEVNEVFLERNKMAYFRKAAVERDSADAFACYMDHRDAYGMELMDVIHAAETALRMEFSEAEVEMLRDAVERKNREMGYYGNQEVRK